MGRVVINASRVLRGGSWNNKAQNVRSANRNNNTSGNRNSNNGFRVASAQTPAVAAVDQMSIQPVMRLHGGEKPVPPGMLVGSAGRLPEGFLPVLFQAVVGASPAGDSFWFVFDVGEPR